jgi:hypothetical protein
MRLLYGIILRSYINVLMNRKIYKDNFASLCYYLFIRCDILCDYDLISNCLHFRMLPSRWRYLDVLFLINVLKGKTNCYSLIDTVGDRVSIRQIREFSTFSVVAVIIVVVVIIIIKWIELLLLLLLYGSCSCWVSTLK